MSKPIPFRLDRAVAANLSDQLADGLRDAIVSGYYRKGEILPTISQLARKFGTSLQVPRAAISVLAAENLVSPRRGVGCTVVGRNPSVWKGRILVAGIDSKPAFDDFCARFSDAGLTVEPVPVRCLQGPGYLERLERNGMKLAMKRFSKPRATWPQLIFWADDFLATGGLLGLAMWSVSIPRDVFAVTIANKGFVPAYPRTLARFEFDPAATARTASAQIIGRLAGSPAAPILELVRYVPGESLPARVGRNAPDPRG